MTATLIAHIDNAAKLRSVISVFKQLQIPFNSLSNDFLPTVEEEDIEWADISQSVLADDADWNSSFDDHWDTLYLQTKNLQIT